MKDLKITVKSWGVKEYVEYITVTPKGRFSIEYNLATDKTVEYYRIEEV